MKIPILKIGQILLASIQVDLSDEDALNFQSELLQEITKIEAVGVAIDITAMDVVDSFMARVINDTASMAKLLGAEVIVSGVQPYVAMTLVEMGRELLGADCAFNLEQALSMLNARIANRGDNAL